MKRARRSQRVSIGVRAGRVVVTMLAAAAIGAAVGAAAGASADVVAGAAVGASADFAAGAAVGASADVVADASAADSAGGGAGRALRICLLEHAPPLSERARDGGFDVDVMAAVSTRLGVPMIPVWIHNDARIMEVEASDLPLAPLLRGRCDAVPSVPGEAALRGAGAGLRLTGPYYGAAFELVGADTTELAGLRGRKVAVQVQTIAHFALQGSAVAWTARSSIAEALEAVDARAADAALVWGPALGPLERAPAPAWQPPQGLRWNEHVALRRDDVALADAIDGALVALAREGEIARLAREHGIPARAPFASVSSPGALAALGIGVRGRP